MRYCIHFLSVLLWGNLLFCGATVNVMLTNSANGNDAIECGSDGIVNCRINSTANIITWVINGTDYATCSPFCTENPASTRHYSPTYDATNKVFILTVDSATFNDSSTSFKCDDGSLYDNITVEVVPAYSAYKTSINDTDEGKQVEFTTACVQPGVTFEWFTVKTNNSERKMYNQDQHEMTNDKVCVNMTCGGYGTVNVSSVITIPTVSGGETRYLEVDVTYINPYEKRRFRFDEPFQFKGPISSTPITSVSDSVPHSNTSLDTTTLVNFKKGSKDGLVIVVSVIGSCIISALAAVAFFTIYKKRKSKARSHGSVL